MAKIAAIKLPDGESFDECVSEMKEIAQKLNKKYSTVRKKHTAYLDNRERNKTGTK